ncbi:hypothetical protein DEO72_LG5g1669 [Vigna unguiculata]|uniref:Uncharacterized protein n=1 Tax=Vigna unguiculata TaxID=3917 RepID=A0A4D6M0I6_VIGUN|nr:hypothetical protein DEO72_LG5g1669 [Vigna unguiculata]
MHMPPGVTLILSPFLDFWYELPGGESGIARRCITIITVSLCCCEFCEIMNSPLFSDVLRLHIVIGAVSGPDVPPGGVMVAARRQVEEVRIRDIIECFWYGAWRSTDSRQAIALARGSALSRRLAARCAPLGGDEKTVRSGGRWRLAESGYRQAVWNNFAWRRVGRARFMDGVTCDDMSGEVHIKLLSRGDTSGEVRRAGLRAGRFVEAGPRAGSSPFLFVCGDDRVIRYTGADVDAGGAEDVQMAE